MSNFSRILFITALACLALSPAASASVTVTPAGSGAYRAVTVGTVLTASQSTGTPYWQWYRCDTDYGDCVDIPGANSASYTTSSADLGYEVVAYDENRYEDSTTRYVAGPSTGFTGAVISAPQADSYLEVESAAKGQPATSFLEPIRFLLYSSASASGPWTFEENCNDYDCSWDDFFIPESWTGRYLKINAFTYDVFGLSRSADSNVVQVKPVPCSIYGSDYPTLTGALLMDGQPISVSQGRWSVKGACGQVIYTYQWQRCNPISYECADIPGATGASYTLAAQDVGQQVRACVSAYSGVEGDRMCSSRTGAGVMPRTAIPAPGPPADNVSPTATASVAKAALRLSALRSRGLQIALTADESSSTSATLTLPASSARRLSLGKKAVTIATWAGRLEGGKPTALTLKLNTRARKALRRARSLTATLTVKASDAAGNSKTVSQTLKFKR